MNRRLDWMVAPVVTLALVMLVLTTPIAVAKDMTYSFNLLGPQTATNGTQTINVSGAGSFDPTAETTVASGTFEITNSNGGVVSAGTWIATTFNSFCSRGGTTSGEQGGVLVITVTLVPKGGGAPITGVILTVNCLIFAPPNIANTCNPVGEGITVTGAVGDFTTIVRGATLFHLNL
jgi:hypothetical protein